MVEMPEKIRPEALRQPGSPEKIVNPIDGRRADNDGKFDIEVHSVVESADISDSNREILKPLSNSAIDWEASGIDKQKVSKAFFELGSLGRTSHLLLENLISKLIDHVDEILDEATTTLQEREKALNRLSREFSKLAALCDPITADIFAKEPQKWVSKRGRSGGPENPVEFIRRVYGPQGGNWLGHGLTRAHLGAYDPKLYDAYAGWIRPTRHPEDDLNLPTTQRENLSQLSPEEALARHRRQRREQVKRTRLRKASRPS